MTDIQNRRSGMPYTYEVAELRAQNPLYQKTDPSRFAFNERAKAQASHEDRTQDSGAQTRSLRKAEFMKRRKNTAGPVINHERPHY
jgi:hypothetical protein